MTKNLIIILSGPIVSFFMIMVGENFKFKYVFIELVAIEATISIVVSFLLHLLIRNNAKKANMLSVIISIFVYELVLIFRASSPEDQAWLMLAMLFLPLPSLPTAISVSIGTGRFMKSWKINEIKE